jgi:cell division protein FtsA
MKKYGSRIVTAIDIGTTKICVLIARMHGHDQDIEIVGIGKTPSVGVNKGVVVDIHKAVSSIKSALKEAELMAGCSVESAYVGISGAHIQARKSHGMVPVKGSCVKDADINAVLTAARSISVPEGQQILHVLPQGFIVDGNDPVSDPRGLSCVRLEVNAHIITGSVASVQNIIRCCQMCDIRIDDVVLEPLASACAVLSDDEKDLGVGLLDIGGGTSDFALYHQGVIKHTRIFPIAGNHMTQDLALCLRTTLKSAEHIKKEHAHSFFDKDTEDRHDIEMEMIHGSEFSSVTTRDVVSIIEPRIEELMYMLKKEINHYDLLPYMPAGLVITGGGSLLSSIDRHARSLLHIPVRCGKVSLKGSFEDSLKNPIHATGYGLLLYACKNHYNCFNEEISGPLITRVLSRMKSWVSDFF